MGNRDFSSTGSALNLAAGVALSAGLLWAVPASASVTLYVAAAGGGGAGYFGGFPGTSGEIGTSGDNGLGSGGGAGGVGGFGGAGGTGADGEANGGGGAGWLGNGGNGEGTTNTEEGGAGLGGFGPPSFAGGLGGNVAGGPANGGFGGGGGGGWQGGGGGGGYSGGGGGDGSTDGGGGGGSYLDPSFTSTVLNAGANGTPNGAGGAANDGDVEIDSTVFSYTGTIQNYIVPTTGVYDILAWGAQGGSGNTSGDIGGYGAEVGGDIMLTAGTDLKIVVGGAGLTGDFDGLWGGGGGGGSFVYSGVIPEPSTWAMLLIGFAGLGFASYRRARAAASLA